VSKTIVFPYANVAHHPGIRSTLDWSFSELARILQNIAFGTNDEICQKP
jgi:hypothetical protein